MNEKSRHQLPKLLKALQYIYINDDLRKPVLDVIENKVIAKLKNSKTGRGGMSYWEILVFALVRLNLNIDYDYLQDLCNNHIKLRGIAGVLNVSDFNPSLVYQLQTLKDNVGLLDETCLMEINEIVVKGWQGKLDSIKQKKNNYLPQQNQYKWMLSITTTTIKSLKTLPTPTESRLPKRRPV